VGELPFEGGFRGVARIGLVSKKSVANLLACVASIGNAVIEGKHEFFDEALQ